MGSVWLFLFLSPFTVLLPQVPQPVVGAAAPQLMPLLFSVMPRGTDCPQSDPLIVGLLSGSVFEVSPWGSFWPQSPSSASSRRCYLPPGKLVAWRRTAALLNTRRHEGALGFRSPWSPSWRAGALCHRGRAVLRRRISTPEPDRAACSVSAGSRSAGLLGLPLVLVSLSCCNKRHRPRG